MFAYRVTKYDPDLRRRDGTFSGSEWTSVGDIGREFGGVVLDPPGYLETETRYVRAVEDAVRLADPGPLRVVDPEGPRMGPQRADLDRIELADLDQPGLRITGADLESFVRAVLRELLWAKLQGEHGFYVHFGWDYYMYLGGQAAGLESYDGAGLFVEPFVSPYDPSLRE